MSKGKYIISGGKPLFGQVRISGAKNAAIKEIAASLLTAQTLVLENVPKISDVLVDLDIVGSLGVEVEFKGSTLTLKGAPKLSFEVRKDLASKSRASVITLGPLLAREGRAVLPSPGGCAIGKRPLDRHLAALESLGAHFEVKEGAIVGKTKGLRGGVVTFLKNTVMGTENVLLAAATAKGETKIVGAAREPEADDLISLLNKMGAKIKRDESEPWVIRIQGVQGLKGAHHKVLPDRNEAVTFAVASALSGGEVTLEDVEPSHMRSFLNTLSRVGVPFKAGEGFLKVGSSSHLSSTQVKTSPHPGFMTDWQQPLSILLAKGRGESLVHETVYEDRWRYLKELSKFGVNFKLYTPSDLGRKFNPDYYNFDWKREGEPKPYLKIWGPTNLTPAKAKITDLRAGATLVLAALGAKGESEVFGVEHIERGYEGFEEKLSSLGAGIKKED